LPHSSDRPGTLRRSGKWLRYWLSGSGPWSAPRHSPGLCHYSGRMLAGSSD
jgi:hypothetical protein